MKRSSQRGYTLTEVMVAIAIGGIVGAMGVTLVTQSQRGSRRLSNMAERSAAARIVINDMARNIESSFPLNDGNSTRFIGTNGVDGADRLLLTVPVIGADGKIAFQEIQYDGNAKADEGTRIEKAVKVNGKMESQPFASSVAGSNVLLEIQYRPRGEPSAAWSDEWNRPALPGAVKIILTYRDARFPNDDVALEHEVHPRVQI